MAKKGLLGSLDFKRKGRKKRRTDNLLRQSGFKRRPSKKTGGLSGNVGMFSKSFGRIKKRSNRGIVADAAASLRERMTPTEKAEIAEGLREEIEERESPRISFFGRIKNILYDVTDRGSKVLSALRHEYNKLRREI